VRQGTLIGPIIIAIGLVVAAVSFALVGALLDRAEGDTELRLGRTEAEIEALRTEVARLGNEVREARAETARLLEDLALRASSAPAPAPVAASQVLMDPGEETEGLPTTEEMTEVMNLAKARFNQGMTQPGNRAMLEILGRPRESFSTDCEPVTDVRLRALLETRDVGPIRVTMIRPALDSLARIMERLRASEPDIHAALGTAGALCARLIRGSSASISNHSWGTAIDLKLEGQLDGFADGGTQFGLLLLAELFNEEGWYWGATYNREDSMHFEVSEEVLRRWAAEGQL
jgi:hypothetical protein